MSIEKLIIISSWLITIIGLLLFIPKKKIRVAYVAFFFKQTITWLFGLVVVEMKLIEYPVRLFPYANKTSFTFEYLLYPAICSIFNVYYPEGKSYLKKILYYFLYVSPMTILEVILEKNTQLIKYIHWTWYWTSLTLFTTFFITRLYVRWFFKLKTS